MNSEQMMAYKITFLNEKSQPVLVGFSYPVKYPEIYL